MTYSNLKIDCIEINDIRLECGIDLEELLKTKAERARFDAKWQDFHEDNVNRDIYKLDGNRLTYSSEQLIPIKRSPRIPILLVLGNPASHSVKSGMFFAYEGKGHDHRFWKEILKPLANLEPDVLQTPSLDKINQFRKRSMLNLDYKSSFKIGLCVMLTMPSAPGDKWGGVQGIQRLLGRKAYRKVLEAESKRVTRIAKTFVKDGGAAIAFQKDAWETLKCERSNAYSIEKAKSHKLIGRLRGAPEIPLYGVPPTRLSVPCRDAIKEITDKLQARQKTKHL